MKEIQAFPVAVVAHSWTATKRDQHVSEKACALFNASAEAGRFTKLLIDSEELRKIRSLDVIFRNRLHEITLEFVSDLRLLPASLYFRFAEIVNDYKKQRQQLVDALLEKYDVYIREAKMRLQDMFCAKDYPSRLDIQRRFRVDVLVLPAPKPSEIPEAHRVLFQMQEERIKQELIERIQELEKRIQELKNKDKIREKTKGNVERDLETLNKLNVTEDQEIKNKIEKLVQVWGGVA